MCIIAIFTRKLLGNKIQNIEKEGGVANLNKSFLQVDVFCGQKKTYL
jgi:hypothetical protein